MFYVLAHTGAPLTETSDTFNRPTTLGLFPGISRTILLQIATAAALATLIDKMIFGVG